MVDKTNVSHLFVKAMAFTAKGRPKTEGFIILQDNSGWFYVNKLVQKEGLKTPFSSIQEIEMFLNEELTLLHEVDLTLKPKENNNG